MTGDTAREPAPRQSKRSQFVDAGFLLALLFVTLFVTTFVLTEEESEPDPSHVKPISQQDISPAEKRQYATMKDEGMVDDTTVSGLVQDNAPSPDKYSIAWSTLGITVVLAVGYLGFVYRTSFREYREVVSARFGARERA